MSNSWVEYDPFTGLTETNVVDESTGDITVHKSQDVECLLERNHELQVTGRTDAKIKSGIWHYMSIPPQTQYEILTKYGVNVHDRNHWPRLFKIINEDYPKLKTTTKHHSLRRNR